MKENVSIKKIVLTGPESSGKTTMARSLAEHFDTVWAPEFAREYLSELGRPYREEDLLHIAQGQLALEDSYAKKAREVLFCDTSLIVLKVWSEFKYGRCHPFILEALEERTYDLFLLCQPDIPWAFDPQRENPGDRDVLLDIYRTELQSNGQKFIEVSGKGDARLFQTLDFLEQNWSIK